MENQKGTRITKHQDVMVSEALLKSRDFFKAHGMNNMDLAYSSSYGTCNANPLGGSNSR